METENTTSTRKYWDDKAAAMNPKNIQAAEANLDAKLAAIRAAREAEWTMEVTQTRRAEWNAKVKAGQVTQKTQIATEKAQGWLISDLKWAVARHNL